MKDWLQGHVASRAKTSPDKREIRGPKSRAATNKNDNVCDRDRKQNDQRSANDCRASPKQTAVHARDKAAQAVKVEEGGGLGLYASAFGWNDADSDDAADDEIQHSEEGGAVPAKVKEEVSWQFSTLGPADAAKEEDWEVLIEEQEHESSVDNQASTREIGADGEEVVRFLSSTCSRWVLYTRHVKASRCSSRVVDLSGSRCNVCISTSVSRLYWLSL